MRVFLIISITLLGFLSASAQDFPEEPTAFVNDYAKVLSAQQAQELNVIIRQIADSTSNEIAVAIFPDAQGYEFSDFALRLARKWGIGNKERNNGVLIVLFIKERGYSFQVGRGLEPVLTDLTTRRIFDSYMKPSFKLGDYFEGLREGILITGQIASGEFAFSGEYGKNEFEGKDIAGLVILLLIFGVIALIFLSRRGGGGNRGGGLGSALPYLFLASQMGRGNHSGWGGGGGFGGSSGGGFGGFGGGSFGGGGSSGSW